MSYTLLIKSTFDDTFAVGDFEHHEDAYAALCDRAKDSPDYDKDYLKDDLYSDNSITVQIIAFYIGDL